MKKNFLTLLKSYRYHYTSATNSAIMENRDMNRRVNGGGGGGGGGGTTRISETCEGNEEEEFVLAINGAGISGITLALRLRELLMLDSSSSFPSLCPACSSLSRSQVAVGKVHANAAAPTAAASGCDAPPSLSLIPLTTTLNQPNNHQDLNLSSTVIPQNDLTNLPPPHLDAASANDSVTTSPSNLKKNGKNKDKKKDKEKVTINNKEKVKTKKVYKPGDKRALPKQMVSELEGGISLLQFEKESPSLQTTPPSETSFTFGKPITTNNFQYDTKAYRASSAIPNLPSPNSKRKRVVRILLFERDSSFLERKQGYGLTLQQGGRALKSLGGGTLLLPLRKVSTSSSSHFIFHNTGKPLIFWGTKSTLPGYRVGNEEYRGSNRNLHVGRQALRKVLLDGLIGASQPETYVKEGEAGEAELSSVCTCPCKVEIKWGESIDSLIPCPGEGIRKVEVHTSKGNSLKADALVGCDGIFSKIRSIIFPDLKETLGIAGEGPSPRRLKYLGLFVMLGLFPSKDFPLFHERVVQLSNGSTRIFMMPFEEGRYMWQLSFPGLNEVEAKQLGKGGIGKLKEKAREVLQNFPEVVERMLECTFDDDITGYPVYDRDPLSSLELEDSLKQHGFEGCPITIIGDAGHPMSPFKGQGANQALLDAFDLASSIGDFLKRGKGEDGDDLVSLFRHFEVKMFERTMSKVLDSRKCVEDLHSPSFIDTQAQMERRGFNKVNNPFLERNLGKMKSEGVGVEKVVRLDEIAFEV